MPLTQVRSKDVEPTFPMKKDPIRRPMQNPQINLETGLPRTTEAEQRAIKDLLEKRTKETKEGSSSESPYEEGTPSKQRRTSWDLVAKKRVGGGAKKKSRKGATVPSLSKGKKILEKAVPSRSDSGRKHGGMLLGVLGQTLAGFSHGLKLNIELMNRVECLINMGKESIKKGKCRQWKRVARKRRQNWE